MEIDSLRKAQQSVGQSAESNLLKAMEQHKENTNKIKEEAAKEIEKREEELQGFKMQLEKSEANRFEQ